MNSSRANLRHRRIPALFVVLVGSLLFSGVTAGGGVCTTGEVTEPFRLPDGPLQLAARLTLCERGEFSPVASFHEVRIDGMPVGLLTSRDGSSEGDSREAPFLMFLRDPDGRLTLLGYAYPTRGGLRTYAFGPAMDANAARAQWTAGAVTPVIVAARLD